MRDKPPHSTPLSHKLRDPEWPHLSDRAFKLLVVATMALAIAIVVLMLAL